MLPGAMASKARFSSAVTSRAPADATAAAGPGKAKRHGSSEASPAPGDNLVRKRHFLARAFQGPCLLNSGYVGA
jgi:hypothetical protein